ncbi:porin family protein [Thiohalobacter thiocyanaticus]|uniref:TIGR03016 family PEP-CTERM system-associated outer membrane protein n=1 Tax=Thiohalobacter thiocyanaticus TaxID=585455 RepID=A0A426QI69_9GAMM|nr:outer membrane beta-barrel protein [Thiohalobacter thiocyanaticus]RRQ21454.1 hypothetical protein D6C00_05540 [Thiohalobacter thiocyanaticus]
MKNRLALTITLALAASPLPAAEWAFEPGVEGRYRYDDNFRLQRDNETDVNEGALSAWADFSRRTARSELTGSAEVTERRFDEDGLDTTDLRFDILSFYNLSQRQRVNLDFNLVKDTTLDTLLEETGIAFDRIERTRATLSPGWLFSYDEKTQFSASLDLSDVTYEDEANTGLGDYRNYGLNLSASRSVTPQTKLILALGASRFERDDDSIQSDNQQLTLGFEHQYSERVNLGGSLGARHTETKVQANTPVCPDGFDLFAPPLFPCADSAGNIANFELSQQTNESSSTGFVGNLNAGYELERGSLSLNASRRVQPNAFSGTTVTDSVVAGFEHRFSERLRADLRVQWTRSEDSSDNSLRLDQSFIRITPSLRWRLARDWSFRASYRYTEQSQEGVSEDATGNAVTLSLSYQWPKMAVSR